MTNELKDRIKNFISSWDNTVDDEFMSLADYDSFLHTAISLLEETIAENNMKQYVVKYYWPKNCHEAYSFVCMADDVEHAIEQCENAYPDDCRILSVVFYL